MQRFNLDRKEDFDRLKSQMPSYSLPEVRRQTDYASPAAMECGLEPLENFPNKIIPKEGIKAEIEIGHKYKLFPIYHQHATWAPPGKRWNQNGLPYCWAWSAAATLMDCRAMEDKKTVLLAPITLGEAVGWRDVGNTLEDTIEQLRSRGIAPASFVPESAWHKRNPDLFDPQWETVRRDFRLGVTWDCNPNRMIQHAASVLRYGRSLYAAWNHLGHAMSIAAIQWNPEEWEGLEWWIRNSHNEDDYIIMTGRNAVPDYAIGFINSLWT